MPYENMMRYKATMIATVLSDESFPSFSEKQFSDYKTVVSSFGTFTR
jgi:hypothetical protein